jgi:hypothetical protein
MTILEMDPDNAGRAWHQPGFFRRQFSAPTTYAQTLFDALFGIVAPVLCFVFDPIVFRSSEFGSALLVDYQAFAYLVSGVEILFLIIWMVWGRNARQATRLAGGILMAGAVFSGLIGILILPFTLMGLMLGIGVLGFIPFLTALVYLRNAKSAFQLAGKPAIVPEASKPQRELKSLGAGARIGATLIGCLIVLGPPAALSFAASMFVSQAMEAVLSGDEQKADLAIDEITYLQFLAPPEFDKLISAYQQAEEPARKEQLKRRYLKLTGNDIDQRRRIFAD